MSAEATQQTAAAVLLVRPAQFGYNTQTADSNRFQQAMAATEQPHAAACAEFDGLVLGLEAAGVAVCCVEDSAIPVKPDAVFPNNWVSFHRDGSVVLYPMHAPNRRLERRPEIIAAACERLGFEQRRCLDLTASEDAGRYLEGTGSLVLDHVQRVAYACRSVRTDAELVRRWSTACGYEPLVFDALGFDGTPIYHTNVMLAIGTHWAVICAEAIEPTQRGAVLHRLAASGRDVFEISRATMGDFAANILELTGHTPSGSHRVLAASARASAALQAAGVWQALCAHVDQPVVAAIATIERIGGGSVRCMLAEVPVERPT